MRWFTSGTSFVYPNMYTLCVCFTSDTSRIPKYVPPYAFGSAQVPLSYTQICTPICVSFHLMNLFRIPKYVHPMRLVLLRYVSRIPKYVPPMRFVHLRYVFRIPKYVPPKRLVHLRYLFRIPKYVPAMRLVHLRYLFRIPKYVPPMRLVR